MVISADDEVIERDQDTQLMSPPPAAVASSSHANEPLLSPTAASTATGSSAIMLDFTGDFKENVAGKQRPSFRGGPRMPRKAVSSRDQHHHMSKSGADASRSRTAIRGRKFNGRDNNQVVSSDSEGANAEQQPRSAMSATAIDSHDNEKQAMHALPQEAHECDVSAIYVTAAVPQSTPDTQEPPNSTTLGARSHEHDLRFVNGQLEMNGYDAVSLDGTSDINAEHASQVLVSMLNEMAGCRDEAAEVKARLRDENMRLKEVQTSKERLLTQVQCLRQDNGALEGKVKMMTVAHKQEKTQLEDWLKESQVQNTKLEGLHKQWQAGANKKEAEYERLKTRMQNMQAQREKSLKRGFVSTASKTQGVGSEVIFGEGASEGNQALDVFMSRTDLAQRAVLIEENDQLRDIIAGLKDMMDGKLEAMHHLQLLHANLESTSITSAASETGIEDVAAAESVLVTVGNSFDVQLPASELLQQVEQMRKSLTQLVRIGSKGDVASKIVDDDANATEEELRERLNEAAAVIAEQDRILRAALLVTRNPDDISANRMDMTEAQECRRCGSGTDGLDSCADGDEYAAEAREELDRTRVTLERMQAEVTEQCETLQIKAEQLDAERHAFEEERFRQRLKHENSNGIAVGLATPVTAKSRHLNIAHKNGGVASSASASSSFGLSRQVLLASQANTHTTPPRLAAKSFALSKAVLNSSRSIAEEEEEEGESESEEDGFLIGQCSVAPTPHTRRLLMGCGGRESPAA